MKIILGPDEFLARDARAVCGLAKNTIKLHAAELLVRLHPDGARKPVGVYSIARARALADRITSRIRPAQPVQSPIEAKPTLSETERVAREQRKREAEERAAVKATEAQRAAQKRAHRELNSTWDGERWLSLDVAIRELRVQAEDLLAAVKAGRVFGVTLPVGGATRDWSIHFPTASHWAKDRA